MSAAFTFVKDLAALMPPQLGARAAAILLQLHEIEGQTATSRQLRDASNMSPPSLTRALDTLAALGYLRRCPRLSRDLFVQLTPRGQRIAREIEEAFAAALPPTRRQTGKVAA